MLFLLSIGLLALTFLSFFLSGKRLYSPSFWLCFVFFVCSVFAFLGNEFLWKEPISSYGPSIIFLSLFLFVIFEFFLRLALRKKFGVRSIQTGSNFSISSRSKVVLSLFSLACMVVEALNFKEEVASAVKIGYTPWALNLSSYIYRLSLEGASTSSLYSSILSHLVNFFIFGGGFVLLFFFIYNFF